MVPVRRVHYPILVLLALVPVGAYLLGRGAPIVALSLVSVGIVSACVYYMFGLGDEASFPPVVE